MLLPLAAYESVANFPAAALALLRVRTAARRVFEVVDAAPAVTEADEPRPLPRAQPAGRTVAVTNLSARYPGADADALSGLDLRIEPDSTTALVGPSGSGKSTVAAALERFLDYDGCLRLDGAELRTLNSDDVRTVIGMCAQDAHVFDTSIGENVRLARRSADDEELWRCSTRPSWANGYVRSQMDWTLLSAHTVRPCPAASVSGWRWLGRCWRISRY